MVIAFIAGGVIGGLFGAALVYMYELRVMRDFGRRVAHIEKGYKHMLEEYPRVAYVCDRKMCEECASDCNHTFDIRHAKNFECIADNEYFEKDTDAGDNTSE